MADKSEPKNTLIAIIGVITVVALFLVTFGLLVFYDMSLQKEDQAVGQAPNTMLQELHNQESEKLNKYAIDPDTGRVQIPIERAMELEVQKPWRPNTPRPKPTPTPEPTPLAQQEATTHATTTNATMP